MAARLFGVAAFGSEGIGLGLEIEGLFVDVAAQNHFRLRGFADVESRCLDGAGRRVGKSEWLLDVNEAESVFEQQGPNAIARGRLLLRHPEKEVQLKNRVSKESLIFHL